MKLSECRMGEVVCDVSTTGDGVIHKIGHIVGFTYINDIEYIGSLSSEEKLERTIPLVRFANGKDTVSINL